MGWCGFFFSLENRRAAGGRKVLVAPAVTFLPRFLVAGRPDPPATAGDGWRVAVTMPGARSGDRDGLRRAVTPPGRRRPAQPDVPSYPRVPTL